MFSGVEKGCIGNKWVKDFFCYKKTVFLALMRKSKLSGIEVVIFSKREQKFNQGHKT